MEKTVVVNKIEDIYVPGNILRDREDVGQIYYLVLTKPTPYGVSKVRGHYTVDMIEWDEVEETTINGVFSVDVKERKFFKVAQLGQEKWQEVNQSLRENVR